MGYCCSKRSAKRPKAETGNLCGRLPAGVQGDYAFSHADEHLPHRDAGFFHKNDAEQPTSCDLFHYPGIGRIFAYPVVGRIKSY